MSPAMAPMDNVGTGMLRYRAFISYSHRDNRLTQRLHRKLESYSVPRALRGGEGGQSPLPANLRPIFRDRDELASTARLSDTIEEALDQSMALVVVCSPAAAASKWVNAEIDYFRRHHPDRPVFAFVVAGDPGADTRKQPERAAFPLALVLEDLDSPDGSLGEPVAADARAEGDGFSAACLKLIAGLLGVRYDQLRQREQRRAQLRWMLVGGLSLVLTAVFAFLAWQATVARDQARAAQASAELELQSEQQTRGFLLSVFQLADANESRGNEVTVREVLDRAVDRIDRTEFKRPEIRSRFLATMGQAYSSLGLNRKSTELLKASIEAIDNQPISAESRSQRVESRIMLADVFYDMGSYDQAIAQLDAITKTGENPTIRQQVKLANLLGKIETYREKDVDAAASFNLALALIQGSAMSGEEYAMERADALSGLALLAQFAGRHAEAEKGYAAAIDLLLPVVGETHPLAIRLAVNRGSNAYSSGNRATARTAFISAQSAARKVYDELSPEIGAIDNNLGRLLLEDGDLKIAEPLLRKALASDRKHRAEDFDDLAYPLANLAYTRLFLGEASEAETLLQEALPIARKNKHAMLATILSGLADIHCSRGDTDKGMGFADAAVTEGVARQGVEPEWVAQAKLTQGYCRIVAGETVDRNEMSKLAGVIRKKWGSNSPFTRRAEAQIRAR